VAELKKKARRERRIIVFIDESGLSQRPHRCRNLGASRTDPHPAIQLQLEESVGRCRSHPVELLLSHLCRCHQERTGRGFSCGLGASPWSPLLIVWDRLPGHRSRLVQEYIAGLISTAYLPPYAPELNPVEYIWGYWKQHELPNVCPKDYWQLSETARRTLRRMRRRPRLITAFWKQSSLWPE